MAPELQRAVAMIALLALSLVCAEPSSLPATMPVTEVLAPEAGLGSADLAWGLWGPMRRSSGEVFRSSARPLAPGLLRFGNDTASIAIGGQVFIRGEARDSADFQLARNDFTLQGDHRARVTVRGSAFGRVGMVIELQDARVWGSEKSTVGVDPFTALHQGFLDLHATEWLDLRLGRQELCYGEDRLIGCLDWAQSGRAFDGLFARVSLPQKVSLDFFGFQTKALARLARTLPDGTPQSLYNTGSYLYGSYLRVRTLDWLAADVYVLGLADDATSFDVGQQRTAHTVTMGARAKATWRGLAVTGEGGGQVGTGPAAGGFALRATYTLPVFGAPYATAEVVAASPTFNQLFPTGHIHLGYIDYVGWSNVVSGHGAIGWKPKGVHVWLDYHHFRYWDPRGRWMTAGGATFVPADPTRTSPVMGNELDLSLTVPITYNVAVASSFAVFFPGAGANDATGAKGQGTSAWGFLSVRGQL